jgi:hypothetical protein
MIEHEAQQARIIMYEIGEYLLNPEPTEAGREYALNRYYALFDLLFEREEDQEPD